MLRKAATLGAVHVWRTSQHRHVVPAWRLKEVLQVKT